MGRQSEGRQDRRGRESQPGHEIWRDGHPHPAVHQRRRGQGTRDRLYAQGKTVRQVQSPLQLTHVMRWHERKSDRFRLSLFFIAPSCQATPGPHASLDPNSAGKPKPNALSARHIHPCLLVHA